jgi:hypothetical protein
MLLATDCLVDATYSTYFLISATRCLSNAIYSSTSSGPAGKAKTVGVLEKKANATFIGGEVVIGKEGVSASHDRCAPVPHDGDVHVSERYRGRSGSRG